MPTIIMKYKGQVIRQNKYTDWVYREKLIEQWEKLSGPLYVKSLIIDDGGPPRKLKPGLRFKKGDMINTVPINRQRTRIKIPPYSGYGQ